MHWTQKCDAWGMMVSFLRCSGKIAKVERKNRMSIVFFGLTCGVVGSMVFLSFTIMLKESVMSYVSKTLRTSVVAEVEGMSYQMSPMDQLRILFEEDQKRHRAEISRLQTYLAIQFGNNYGWVLSSAFSPRCLARNGHHDGKELSETEMYFHHSYGDHPYYYRQNNRAIAVVAHLYDLDDDDKNLIFEWADGRNLKVSYPDEPSWWYPDVTKMVLFEPKNS